MKTIEIRIIGTGILILFTIISGIWLSRLGRPLNVAIFAIHKIIALLTIILTVITIYYLQKNVKLKNIELILMVVTGLIFLFAFVSGAILSFEKPVNLIILTIHKVTSFLIVISTTLTIYILVTGRLTGR